MINLPVKFLSAGREIPGEDTFARARRIQEEFSAKDRYRKAYVQSRGAAPLKVTQAIGDLQRYDAYHWTMTHKLPDWDEFRKLSGRVTREIDKLRADERAERALNRCRDLGMIAP